ncbi:Serine/arginine-rich splicing factor like [Actinidia chinensis var. chinensis]|uniref:Serine/arginine-rich splicing factor like n=1 Tax=Actinidia chinensis var. chinensis TaxID=1590841 RepID=A0A2R6RA42_ACTCC|nr:Serine/arginine-rich splicing factor like [Actinidia chinensis var. chinensis]
MSLHLGNISSHVRREELERVFRRFGRCNVQLKDGFGFVVYDFPANAEKALRVLRGKNICGEPISLSWSNRQPRSLQRFSSGNRFYEMQRRSNSARGEYFVNRKVGSKGRQDYKIGLKHPEDDDRRLNSADMIDEATSYHQDSMKEHIGEKQHGLGEALPAEGDNVHRNLVDNDRWGERVGVPTTEIGIEGGLEFDLYEPYHDDDDRRDEDGNQLVTHSGSSRSLRKSQDKIERAQMGDSALNGTHGPKSHQICYICGELGHKMRSCPRENASRRKMFSRFDRGRDDINFRDKGEGDMKRLESKSWRRPHLSRDAVLMSRHKSYGKASNSRKHQRLPRSGSFQLTKETHRGEWRKDYLEKKQSRRENLIPERRAKKSRGPMSSPIHSDYTSSRSLSYSESSKSVSRSGSRSKSRSASSRTCSLSSRLRFGSISKYSGSENPKSEKRSRSSSSISLSLSVSLGQALPSSPNKIQMNHNGSLVDTSHTSFPESKEALAEQAQQVEGDAGLDNCKLENMTVPLENNNAVAAFEVVEDTKRRDHSSQSNDNNNCAVPKVSSEVKDSCSPLVEKGDVTVESLSPRLGGMKDIQISDTLGMEQTLAPTKGPVSEALVTENLPASTKKPNQESSVRSRIANPTSISSEEPHMVLKHYGLDHPVENGKDSSLEAYFGAARLWPWEIIYYRRLRKGPISTENYARRVAQNQEFGIVDKYIRSSSGWGELGQENV